MLLRSAVRRASPPRCRTVVILVFALIFGSAARGQPAAKDAGKCVGVISAIGDTLTLTKVAAFNVEESRVPVDAWHIDDLIFSKVSAVLGNRFNLKRISISRGAFALIEEDHGPFYNSAEDVRSILRKVTMAARCDQYLVMLKTDVRFKNGQRVSGLGIQAAGERYFAMANFAMHMYDGQNFSMLAKHPASIGRNFLGVSKVPSRQVDETWWPMADAGQSQKLKDGFRALVAESLDVTLPEFLRSD